MENLLKSKLMKNQKVLGTFSMLGSETAIEALSYSGLDYIIIDTEHGPFDVESTLNFIRVANLKKLTAGVRIKDSSRHSVLKMLDAGAEMLIIPNIESVEEVERIVSYAKYPPVGCRGVAIGRVGGFGYEKFVLKGGLTEYFETCNRETMLLPQCETIACLENIDEILKVEGVDGVFVGPYDLSVALGNPGNFETKDFKEALERIKKATEHAKKYLFIFTGNEKDVNMYFNSGYNGVALSTDIKLFISNLRKIVDRCKG